MERLAAGAAPSYAIIIGAYVHGSFYHLGETTHALVAMDAASRPYLLGTLGRQLTVMMTPYAVIFAGAVLASGWLAVLIGSGTTRFPRWMAAVNPVTLTLVWLGGKKLLPQRVRDSTEGAGFNIAMLAFFALITLTLW